MNDPGPPPPIYSQQDPDIIEASGSGAAYGAEEPQILLIPTVDAINFQKGCLGVDGERAAIEGELQIKGVDPGRYSRVTIGLRTIESAHGEKDIELNHYDTELYPLACDTPTLPASLLFSIPLPDDTPQSFETPHSSLRHMLTATLHASNPVHNVQRSLQVHTKRYSPHGLSIPICPETYSSSDPSPLSVEVPRRTFTSGEPIPIYVTIPSPDPALVEAGLRLRNVRAELVRSIRTTVASDGTEVDMQDAGGSSLGQATSSQTLPVLSSTSASASKAPLPPFAGDDHQYIVSRSGGQCRFAARKPVKLRFVLQQSSPQSSPVHHAIDLDEQPNQSSVGSYADCDSISQTTLLHSISFHVQVRVSFVEPSSRTERVSTITIPVTLLPTPAPLPEVAPSLDIAYQKKHDKPPTRTNRFEEMDAPGYSEIGVAGPSSSATAGFGAPPPFDEGDDAPPSFLEASSSTFMPSTHSPGLPSFQEAESEIIMPPPESSPQASSQRFESNIEGEGTLFGFPVSEQYDGHSDSDIQRDTTPPPTLEMATMDTDVTQLAGMPEPERSIEALGIALEQQQQQQGQDVNGGGGGGPPPPPAMDDPSDPPPSIDSDFRAPRDSTAVIQQPVPVHASVRYSSPPPELPSVSVEQVQRQVQNDRSEQNAPPPYLGSHREHEEEHATGPPPYMG